MERRSVSYSDPSSIAFFKVQVLRIVETFFACLIYYPAAAGFHYGMDQCQLVKSQPSYRRLGTKKGGTDNDRYRCPKCEKSYRHLHHMLRHSKFECGSPPRFQCPYCGMRSKQSNNVYKHIRCKHPGSKLEIVVLHYDQQ